ncbi:hypothetical protein FT663_03744 [Candidozyma haemuli var. vulneris]|uniref:Uncharacterized protein n=1 Tax=Candidozyma haemuli TaxID=45357 RepID=A0A2V1ALV8_9ASCO|nr:hypothetical protein CXQ85_000937 [[Candida] haemuloni]KAF3987595.1 hypothetical protein FT662_03901 [[Candida] haemuloni var. vulneris]KAF3989147.1 hypothetical protein FT663_03744 [[Candida] haemuloni var. vulneris]PVH18654.1 hypothetical protein CXQ85_000937 [[Candida] haemuloni]
MFKSVLSLGWFSKASSSSGPLKSSEVNTSFTMPDRDSSQVYHVSMNDDAEDFVDIAYRKLSYAEVASIGRHRQQTSQVPRCRASSRMSHNQYTVLSVSDDDDDMAESVYSEKFKINNYFSKNKVFKEADKSKAARSKQKKIQSHRSG